MSTQSRKTILLATDQQQSVLNALDANQPNPIAYTPYGHRPRGNGLLSLLGFNGELPDPLTGHYHLGKGYRQFNPVLMRFNSPDSWSPFGEGGLNAYAYCEGDPRNRIDPTGHFWGIGKFLRRLFGMKPKTSKAKNPTSFIPDNTNNATVNPTIAPGTPTANFEHLEKIAASDRTKYQKTTSKQQPINVDPSISPNPAELGSSQRTKELLLNRRSQSLDFKPDPINKKVISDLIASKSKDPVNSYLISIFASNPNNYSAKLYTAMTSELSQHPNASIQRTIRTGGHYY